ncbi:hypothetical protein GCM10023224_04960 [Streptomonospora halophila]|uniref:SPW repeat-containing protein n=1 Tax=Streptomonospora halophila TaxID=427369 RepID=A0ABP9G5N5_9ACTN
MTQVVAAEGGRWLRGATYLMVICGGAWSLWWPGHPLLSGGGQIVAFGYAAAMVAGGLSCLYGTLRGRWSGELLGLPMVTVSTAAVAIALWWHIPASLGLSVLGTVATVCTLLLADRWRGVWKIAHLAREAANRAPRSA